MVEPKKIRRLGKGGTLQSRQAIVHSLVNIESWAVDLSWWVDHHRPPVRALVTGLQDPANSTRRNAPLAGTSSPDLAGTLPTSCPGASSTTLSG